MRFRELLRKDLAELFAGRAFWLMLILTGLLAGQAFITAVNAYAEASGILGGPAALAEGLSPLDGILTPTLGAYDLAITLILPFVMIRLVAGEKSTDAIKLMQQWPVSMRAQLASKVTTLLIAWLVALIPFAIAVALWRAYGGHVYAPEVVNLLVGYTARYLLTASLSMAAAAIMPGAANAAVVILGFTIGTWALDFFAAGRGGFVQRIAAFTPTATLRHFERGLLRADVLLVMIVLTLLGCAITAIWLRLGRATRAKLMQTAIAMVIAALLVMIAARMRTSADVSENRRSSFAPSEERMLRSIDAPLTMTVFLAAEDPRMADLESNVLVKLRRTMRHLDVEYPLAGRSGLFENDDRYGEIVYAMRGKREVSRSTTEAIVIETIATMAGVAVPQREESSYPGYPLAQRPAGAAWMFYALWPAAVIAAWITASRSRRSRRTG